MAWQVKNCAMGHWGIAMSYLQPLWSYPTPADMQAGQEALRKARLTLNDPKVTELEKGHIWVRGGERRSCFSALTAALFHPSKGSGRIFCRRSNDSIRHAHIAMGIAHGEALANVRDGYT